MSIFENYKRPIYLIVAIFALITFSITGVMLSFIGDLARPTVSSESIELSSGERVNLTEDDLTVGLNLAKLQRNLSAGIDMPAFVFSNVAIKDARETFAILRRVAVDQGIDVADEDVAAVLDFACRQKESMQPNQPPPQRLTKTLLAKVFGAGSLVELEEMVREALRVSILVRSEMQGIDLSEAALADYVKKNRKRRSVSYVAWDGKVFRKELERLPPTDQDLMAWIMDLPDNERMPYVNAEVVAFQSAGMTFDQVDPAEWKELLEGTEIGDADIEARYNQDKETLYKLPDPPKEDDKKDGDKENDGKKDDDKKKPDDKDGGLLAQDPKPAPKQDDDKKKSDEKKDAEKPKQNQGPIGPLPPDQVGYRRIDEVKGEIQRKLEVEAIIRKLSEKAEQALAEAVDKLRKSKEPKKEDAPKEKAGDGKSGDGKDGDGKDGAGNDAKAKDDKDGGLQGNIQIPGAGEQSEQDKAKLEKEAQERLQKQREEAAAFDFKKWYDENMAGKKGAVWVDAKKELSPPDKFQDFEPFGKWSSYWTLSQLTEVGAISNLQVGTKGAFFVRIADRKTNVAKPIAEIRETALTAYYDRESSAKAKKLAEDFRKLVRTKAEGLKKDEVAKLREAVPGKVDTRMKTWRDKLDAEVASIQKKLSASGIPTSAIPVLQKQLEDARGKIALESEERKAVQKAEDDKLEEEIKKLVEPVMAEAFGLAAKDKKLDAKTLGPFFDDESQGARFSLREDGPEKFLKSDGTIQGAEKGVVSDPVEDASVQTWYVVRIDAVEDGDDSAITRKAMESVRDQFVAERVRNVLTHSFSHRALKERYRWKTTQKKPDENTTETGG